ncbi:hypothetical protein [Streptomyces sp. ISL-11]|uniref:hypothetical protein n=1 Tax=Streptomyces sp. ISL-11 TaxID=2819174 RepID=UPI001BE8DC0F|nr:hypothetical protein [Streptomyces sp. ISL-11]MBT2383896.1 hypothetical protein [Streptomyces sp. ISL-11]
MDEPELDSFKQIIDGLTHDLRREQLEQRGTLALLAARITGVIYQDAVAHGVPHALAQEMAGDFWSGEMGRPPCVMPEGDDGVLHE